MNAQNSTAPSWSGTPRNGGRQRWAQVRGVAGAASNGAPDQFFDPPSPLPHDQSHRGQVPAHAFDAKAHRSVGTVSNGFRPASGWPGAERPLGLGVGLRHYFDGAVVLGASWARRGPNESLPFPKVRQAIRLTWGPPKNFVGFACASGLLGFAGSPGGRSPPLLLLQYCPSFPPIRSHLCSTGCRLEKTCPNLVMTAS